MGKSIPIEFVVGSDAQHAPIVTGTILGTELCFIVDTGSTDHVLDRSALHHLAFSTGPGNTGTDHAGGAVESWSVVGVEVEQCGDVLPLGPCVAIELPRPLVSGGIAGVLSPQRLVRPVTIDLIHHEFRLGSTQELGTTLIRREGLLGVEVRVGGRRTLAMANTGTPDTEVVPGLTPGAPETATTVHGAGLGGTGVRGSLAEAIDLEVAGVAHGQRSVLVRDVPFGFGAMLGMDVLAGSVLALDGERASAWFSSPL